MCKFCCPFSELVFDAITKRDVSPGLFYTRLRPFYYSLLIWISVCSSFITDLGCFWQVRNVVPGLLSSRYSGVEFLGHESLSKSSDNVDRLELPVGFSRKFIFWVQRRKRGVCRRYVKARKKKEPMEICIERNMEHLILR